MKRKILNILLSLTIFSLGFCFYIKPSQAYATDNTISNKWFYIKNAYSGKYLDVHKGTAADGTNVEQYEFNGGDNQKWFLFPQSDGTYIIGSKVGHTTSDGTINVRYALDVNGGNNGSNEVNIQLWRANGSNAQKFAITKNSDSTYALRTAPSNYNRVIAVQNKSCANGQNVFQFDYNKSDNDEWILEPVSKDLLLGSLYATTNYNKYAPAYPKLTSFEGESSDCANFASQCLLASGQQHYQNNWKVYRKNNNYSAPSTRSQLDNSWELCQPSTSPWISAAEFGKFWKSKKVTHKKGADIINNPDTVWNIGIGVGDIIQIASPNKLGGLGDSWHTMYVSEVDYNNKTYILSYHSSETKSKKLSDIVKIKTNTADYSKYYYVFFDM